MHYEGNGDGYHYNFAGKLADTFEYPYTIELTFTASSLPSVSCILTGNYFVEGTFNYITRYLTPKSQIGKFTFHDASTLTASVIMMTRNRVNGLAVWYYMWITRGDVQTLNFTKQ